jgi:TonB family protein
MASILIPPKTPTGPPSEDQQQFGLESTAFPIEFELTPHVLIQLEDDLERSRMREAFWISVSVHLLIVIFLAFSPKLFYGSRGIVLRTPADMLRDKELTYLDLPPDLQKAPKVSPNAKVLSDKNRIAMSRHPQIDQKTLQELKRAGLPGPSAPQTPPSPSAQMSSPEPQGQQPPAQNQQMSQNLTPVPNPKLPATPSTGGTPNFAQMMKTPGDITRQAAASAAAGRGSYSMGGGAYGAGPGGSARTFGNLDVLSDTQGVDFGPYLERVLEAVRRNWYNLIPEEARAPLLKKGKVAIEFSILPDGRVAGMKLTGPSGDIPLDRAAWGGITASIPFAPLPSNYHAPYFALRFRFYYNPGKGDLD